MLVAPMRQQLESVGFKSLMTPSDVETEMNNAEGTKLLVFNSVCGCAAGTARPGVMKAVQEASKKPSSLVTVFAGQEAEAVAKAREFTAPFLLQAQALLCIKMANWFILSNATILKVALLK